ncbi:YraN family protein [Patescibacteria group bacterium]|nr:YraN family protein [Patescibacteria group bacterium]MBU1663434.1 YraN family protein [Patescibacteria group bacterium]MBU1933642.1 YraN family protein [Patescibacteria group bacterium]MBU2007776.1 YraN family protein [Patescibacteria group bacterium]MBU2233754.1 YraN family protein [Patescibacteria group bacterium]
MTHNQRIGEFGETLAKNYLIKQGYQIIDANVKLSYQELDVVALKNDQIIFVEVKTRISQFYGSAENAFQFTKLERFRRGMEMYIGHKKLYTQEVRADLITIDIDQIQKTAKIKHYKDVV